MEALEERQMLDGGAGSAATLPLSIVVGRTLSVPTVSDIRNGQVSLTYTVYNQSSSPQTGVQLTTNLAAGVTYAGATQAPDQDGQSLAWSLGTIPGYGRASVSVTVNLAAPSLTILDGGASASASLDAGSVSDTAPAAVLLDRVVDPALLSSTIDANTSDPIIQEKVAELDYDWQRILGFLKDDVGYEAYRGSVRGARGTLWSEAGNALDVSSLGVALLRASGIPSRYATGSLPASTAGALIRSMFPAQYQTVGFLPAASQAYDPAADPVLLSIAQDHAWLQFDVGGGMLDADLLVPGAAVGQSYATAAATFAEVDDSLREKTRIQVVAEITNTATQLFGIPGQSTTTVLDRVFNNVELVGRPLTIGNFVSSSTQGFVFSATTNTYTPYLNVGDLADLAGVGDVVTGQPYQEVLTNFPFGTQALTGLFLNVTLSGPQGNDETVQSVLFDRLGYAARRGLESPPAMNSDGTPALSDLDLFTLFVLPGRIGTGLPAGDYESVNDVLASVIAPDFQTLPSDVQVQRFMASLRDAYSSVTRMIGTRFLQLSDARTDEIATSALVKAYFSRPRLIISSSRTSQDANMISGASNLALDLIRDAISALPFPGQDPAAVAGFRSTFGVSESMAERDAILSLGAGENDVVVNVPDIMNAAIAQGIPIVVLGPADLDRLDGLAISAQAQARIREALAGGLSVIVPESTVDVKGVRTIGWYQVNRETGETVSVGEDGRHPSLVFWSGLAIFSIIGGILEVAIAIQCYAPLQQQYEINRINLGEKRASEILLAGILKCEGEVHSNAAKMVLKMGEVIVRFALSLLSNIKLPDFPPPTNPPPPPPQLPKRKRKPRGGRQTAQAQLNQNVMAFALQQTTSLSSPPPWTTDPVGLVYSYVDRQYLNRGPAINPLSGLQGPSRSANVSRATTPLSANRSAGAVSGNVQASSLEVAGRLSATWSSATTTGMSVRGLSSASAVVRGPGGDIVASGPISLTSGATSPVSVSGQVNYALNGDGTLRFGASPTQRISAGADWDRYDASLSGSIRLQITTDGLSVGGTLLPAGTYTIESSAVQLSGEGSGISPTFSGSIQVAAEQASVVIGAGGGSLSLGGSAVDPATSLTLTGFAGSIGVAGGSNAVGLAISGSAVDAMSVSRGSSPLADQNTPALITTPFTTSLSGDYYVTATAPEGWAVSVDDLGRVSATPAPGLAPGEYPVRIVVQSIDNDALIAQTTVMVSVAATQAGLGLSSAFDPELGVPYNGAYLPTGFRLNLQNLGPAADAYQLSFGTLPDGFKAIATNLRVDVPAGRTGIVGVYLVPDGTDLPPPGTLISLPVTVTSLTDLSITRTETLRAEIPVVEAVTIRADSTRLAAVPGQPATTTVRVTNAGNVPEDVTFDNDFAAGLTIEGLPALTLQPGESRTLTVTITPAPGMALGTTLVPTLFADYGPADDPYEDSTTLTVEIQAPGVVAIHDASEAAARLGVPGLSDRLGDLGTALTDLFVNPSDPVSKGRALASLDAVIRLLDSDPAFATNAAELTAARVTLADAATAQDVQSAIDALSSALEDFSELANARAAHQFELSIQTNTQVARPGFPATFSLILRNTGSESTTYLLSLEGLSAGLSGAVSPSSITLAPGEVTTNVTVTITPDATVDFASLAFIVRAIAQEAPAITRTASGSLTARDEFVSVASVSTDPPFIEPGGSVNVSTRVLNAVNRASQALASFVVKDASNNVVFTSTPVAFTLSVQTALTTVELGAFDTTGLRRGNYRIEVAVTTPSGDPIPGGQGSGNLLIGSPVTGTLTLDRDELPAGSSTVTTTLEVQSQETLVGPLGLVSQTELAGAVGVARSGNYVYASGSSQLNVYDVTNPAAPSLVRSFGSGATQLEVRGDKLYSMTRSGPFDRFYLRIYSLSDPSNPQLLGSAKYTDNVEGIPYSLAWHMIVTETHVYVSLWSFTFLIGGQNDIKYQTGDIIAIDVSDATAPVFVSALKNTYGTNTDGIERYLNVDISSGDGPLWEIAQLDANTLLVSGSTVKRDDTQDGEGVVHVVDISDPAHMTIVKTLVIPGTVHAVGLSVDGDRAFVTGSTTGWEDLGSLDFTGKTVLAVLDVSDHRNPVLLGQRTLDRSSRGPADQFTAALGNDVFVFSSRYEPTSTEAPAIFVVDAHDPQNLVLQSTTIPSFTTDLAGLGNYVYTTSSNGLLIYQIEAADAVPVTARVEVPKQNGVSYVPGSFSIEPSQIISGTDSDILVFDLSLTNGAPTSTIAWQTAVNDLSPAEKRRIIEGATLEFVSQGSQGQVALSPLDVVGQHLLGLAPGTLTVHPGEDAEYTLHVTNPFANAVTYELSIQGVPGYWSTLPATVTVAGSQSLDVSFTLRSDIFTPTGSYGFSVIATDAGVSSSVGGDLALDGEVLAPDGDSHGVVASLTPGSATAGQGTAASYSARIFNTGSTTETFAIAADLPAGITAVFSRTTVTVLPGAFVDVPFTLSPQPGTPAGVTPFSIRATSTSDAAVVSTAAGSLTVLSSGVRVTLDPPAGGPGSSYSLTVTNTGDAPDSFSLALAGPGALIASLGRDHVTLAPGESLVVPIATQAAPFAVPGSLGLTAVATSQSNTSIRDGATAALMIAESTGLSASLTPPSMTLPAPGSTSFTVIASNTGNTEDQFSASIVGTSGPITAQLIGLDGLPTQSIPLFLLPALGNATLPLNVQLTGYGQGSVEIRITSLTTGQSTIVTASVVANAPVIVPSEAPKVVLVQRYGVHMMASRLVLTFDLPLDPARAQDLRAYRLVDPRGRVVPIRSAVYDSAANTVTLIPARRINVHQRYVLTVDGASPRALADPQGRFLDGNGDGTPGGDFVTSISWRNAVLPPAWRAAAKARAAAPRQLPIARLRPARPAAIAKRLPPSGPVRRPLG